MRACRRTVRWMLGVATGQEWRLKLRSGQKVCPSDLGLGCVKNDTSPREIGGRDEDEDAAHRGG
jgi:hypothetical protein